VVALTGRPVNRAHTKKYLNSSAGRYSPAVSVHIRRLARSLDVERDETTTTTNTTSTANTTTTSITTTTITTTAAAADATTEKTKTTQRPCIGSHQTRQRSIRNKFHVF